MKKRILVCVTCVFVAGIYVNAQNNNPTVTSTALESEQLIAIALPPPPPEPPIPPAPPMPPMSPMPNITSDYEGSPTVEIINSNGYEISVHMIHGRTMVVTKKDGKTQKIRLTTWNSNRKYYEKKYGQLPPVPPAPSVTEDEVEFTTPDIKLDN